MSILHSEIRGPAKPIIVGLLAGIALGAIGGSVYGYVLERREMQTEIQKIRDGRVNYRSDDGPVGKVAGYIRSQARADGLWAGIPSGAAVGLIGGIGVAMARSPHQRKRIGISN